MVTKYSAIYLLLDQLIYRN